MLVVLVFMLAVLLLMLVVLVFILALLLLMLVVLVFILAVLLLIWSCILELIPASLLICVAETFIFVPPKMIPLVFKLPVMSKSPVIVNWLLVILNLSVPSVTNVI